MNIILCGHYGAKNIGDELILKSLIKIFKEINKDINITVLSADPKETRKKHKIDSHLKFPAGIRSLIGFLKKENRSNIKALKKADYFVLGGGGLFGGPSKKANFIWFVQGVVASLYKKTIIFIGQSIGSNLNWLDKKMLKFVLKRSKFISVRDNSSKEIIKTLDKKFKVDVFPDLVLNLKCKSKESKTKQIVFALRNINTINEKFITEIQNFIKWISATKSYKIKLLSFQGGAKDNDEKLNKEINKGLQEKVEIISNMNEDEIINELQKSSIAVTMRLHSMILSILTKTPFIGISYADKVNAFYKYTNLNGYLVKQEDLNADLLKSEMQNLEENKKAYADEMTEFSKKAKTNLQKEIDILKMLL